MSDINEILVNEKYILNGVGDIGMDSSIRKYIDTEVLIIDKQKNGLYTILNYENQTIRNIPKRNFTRIEDGN